MIYFTFVTISTVGYGDYSPETVMGRAFVVIMIFIGVAFFTIETGNLIEVQKVASSGRGEKGAGPTLHFPVFSLYTDFQFRIWRK